MRTNCLFCGACVSMINIHGHYQCPVCKTNAFPCCDADNCNNLFLSEHIEKEELIVNKKTSEKSNQDIPIVPGRQR